MQNHTERIDSSDGRTSLYLRRWEPSGAPRAVVQIAHGMVEFIDRYDRFASVLADEGIVVYGHDHLGHGYSVVDKSDWGFFAENYGNRCVLEDMFTVQHLIRERHPDLPYFLLGHSMGSFLVRQYLHTFPEDRFSGVIILGTGMQPQWLLSLGYVISKLTKSIKGARHRSPFLTKLSLGSNNKFFKPNRTACDWLTRDEAIALLGKLSSDDAFRAQFEKDPATALQKIGFGADDVAALPADAKAALPLPPKEQFGEALKEIREAGFSDHVCIVVPLLKATYGDRKE